MKNQKKPKGKTPSLIGSTNGKPVPVDVSRKSECRRCHSEIQKGEKCIGIPDLNTGFNTVRRYCKVCYENIIIQTQKDLDELKLLLN